MFFCCKSIKLPHDNHVSFFNNAPQVVNPLSSIVNCLLCACFPICTRGICTVFPLCGEYGVYEFLRSNLECSTPLACSNLFRGSLVPQTQAQTPRWAMCHHSWLLLHLHHQRLEEGPPPTSDLIFPSPSSCQEVPPGYLFMLLLPTPPHPPGPGGTQE